MQLQFSGSFNVAVGGPRNIPGIDLDNSGAKLRAKNKHHEAAKVWTCFDLRSWFAFPPPATGSVTKSARRRNRSLGEYHLYPDDKAEAGTNRHRHQGLFANTKG